MVVYRRNPVAEKLCVRVFSALGAKTDIKHFVASDVHSIRLKHLKKLVDKVKGNVSFFKRNTKVLEALASRVADFGVAVVIIRRMVKE